MTLTFPYRAYPSAPMSRQLIPAAHRPYVTDRSERSAISRVREASGVCPVSLNRWLARPPSVRRYSASAYSVCFVNGVSFPDQPNYHTSCRLRSLDGRVVFDGRSGKPPERASVVPHGAGRTGRAAGLMAVFPPKWRAAGRRALPSPLDVREIRRAMAVLKILAQNDLERELYKGRLKAKRDLQNLETLPDQWQQRYLEAEHRLDVVRRERDETRRNAEKQGFAELRTPVPPAVQAAVGRCRGSGGP